MSDRSRAAPLGKILMPVISTTFSAMMPATRWQPFSVSRLLRDVEDHPHRRDDRTTLDDPTPDADPLELSVPGYIDSPERLRALS